MYDIPVHKEIATIVEFHPASGVHTLGLELFAAPEYRLTSRIDGLEGYCH